MSLLNILIALGETECVVARRKFYVKRSIHVKGAVRLQQKAFGSVGLPIHYSNGSRRNTESSIGNCQRPGDFGRIPVGIEKPHPDRRGLPRSRIYDSDRNEGIASSKDRIADCHDEKRYEESSGGTHAHILSEMNEWWARQDSNL